MRDVELTGLAGPKPAPVIDTSSQLRTEAPRRRRIRKDRGPVKILFISANTLDGNQLALDEEYRAIEQRILKARHRDDFQLIAKLAVRRSDLQDALLLHCPDVVHFACHGSAQAELHLAGDGPASDQVSAEALASLLEAVRDNLELVVFNACFASLQAAVIPRCTRLAIGMRARIDDTAAIAFASALYGALAYGRSVQDAFELGRAAMDSRHRQLPQLFHRPGVDPCAVRLVRAPGARRWLRLLTGAAVVAAIAVLWLRIRSERAPGPERDVARSVVRFAATTMRPGVFEAGLRPAVCSSLDADEDCAVLVQPERVRPVRVAAFELDVMEVSNRELAAWLNANHQLWQADPDGLIVTRQQPAMPLVLASSACLDALVVKADGRVEASADKALWPAVCVSWHGANGYCRAQRKRLPLAVEWELAAAGVEGRPFPWGNELPRQDGVAFDLREGVAAHPHNVGSSAQDVTPDGVHDLGGSVAEWVDDERSDGETESIRGGSWGSRGPCHLLGSGCARAAAVKLSLDVGFRCASSVLENR